LEQGYSAVHQQKIMIIDDEPDVTITLQSVLEKNGFGTDSYNDPVEAYKNFRDGQYDLVLLDIRMPVIDFIYTRR